MAVLTATCWTATILPTRGNTTNAPLHPGVITNRKRTQHVRLDLDNAATDLVYPSSGGIPLPTTPSSYGMSRNVDYIIWQGEGFTGTGPRGGGDVLWKFDPTANNGHGALFGFWQGPTAIAGVTGLSELPTTWTPTLSAMPHKFFVVASGW